jgi:glycosyltransferase involved in cell wall biosynthesis
MTELKTKVVHVTSAHPWTDNRIYFRECESLAHAGYDVTLIAVESAIDSREAAAAVVRLPRRGRVRRVLLGSPRAILEALRVRPRVVHLHDPELVWAIPLLRVLGKKVIYDAHEDLPAQVLGKPYLNRATRPVAVWLARGIVGLASSSHHVIAATDAVARRYPQEKVTVVRNYPPLRAVEQEPTAITERPRTAVYVGTIAWSRGLRAMIAACASPSFPQGWRTRIVGALSNELRAAAEDLGGADCVDLVGAVAPPAARDEVLNARVGYVLLQPTPAFLESLPTKMFEYFAAGVPVIASDFPFWRSLIGDEECGVFVDPSDPDAIADAIARYDRDPDLLARHSSNARRLALERYNWTTEAASLLDAYVRVLR